jgi:peptide/nickel transport system ATP-binding protein
MLDRVGLAAETFVSRYPHELSGGQRQRVAIARAMIVEPRFVVADEPTSMLDVSVRAGIMELMLQFKRDAGVSYLYVTHDLAVARYLCERIAVMHRGRIVETGPTDVVLDRPLHAYTRALITAVPVPDPSRRRFDSTAPEGRADDPWAEGEIVRPGPLVEREPGHWVADSHGTG